MAGVVLLARRFIPGFAEAVTSAKGPNPAGNPGLTSAETTIITSHALRDLVFSMVGAFFIIIPVAWVYILTKLHVGYDEAVVHTMIVLPLLVAAVAVLVRDSLPLAFSLAGIVAAVRYRSNLEDTKDTVYVFAGIVIGLAAGVEALPTALLMSLIFNAVILFLWRFNIGNIYADRLVLRRNGGNSDLLGAPTPDAPVLAVGDPQLLAALSAQELTDVATRLAHIEKYIAASADKAGDRFDSVFLVHVRGIEPAQRAVEPVFKQVSMKWRLAEITPGRDGTSTIEYLVRLPDGTSPGGILDRLRAAGAADVIAAEYKSLKALRKKKQKK